MLPHPKKSAISAWVFPSFYNVRTQIIDHWEEQDEPEHLRTIKDRILHDKKVNELLSVYESILQAEEYYSLVNKTIRKLMLTGLVVRHDSNGKLNVANRIYTEVFDKQWIKQNLAKIVEYRSERGIDYTQLRNLLAEGKWKESAQESSRIMLKIANREQEGWLNDKDIETFPLTDLHTIYKLWVKTSQGRFCWSVQKQNTIEEKEREFRIKLGKLPLLLQDKQFILIWNESLVHHQNNETEILVYDSQKDKSFGRFPAWESFSNVGRVNKKLKKIDEANTVEIKAIPTEYAGLNKSIDILYGRVEFEYKIIHSKADDSNVIFCVIPMQADKNGLIEVGTNIQDHPRNPYSIYRIRKFVPLKHFGDNEWHSMNITFDFRDLPHVSYTIFAPRINEGSVYNGFGHFMITKVKIFSE